MTKKQRNIVYRELLKVVYKDPDVDNGMCFYLTYLLDRDSRMPLEWSWLSGIDKMLMLPELNRHDNGKPYFAPLTAAGWRKRIKWIEQAIKETL